jgi:hypothetical protein
LKGTLIYSRIRKHGQISRKNKNRMTKENWNIKKGKGNSPETKYEDVSPRGVA